MSPIRIFIGSLIALLVSACAAVPADTGARKVLCPTGKLRVGLISVPVHAIRDPYSGELRGISHDLGRALAARLGVPFEPIMYPNPATYVAAGQAGEWDVGSLALVPERQASFDFAQPHLEVDYGCLVAAGTGIASISGVDRPGVRVALVERSASEVALTKVLKHASEFVNFSARTTRASERTRPGMPSRQVVAPGILWGPERVRCRPNPVFGHFSSLT